MSRLYMSLEISQSSWKICFSSGGKKKRIQNLPSVGFKYLPRMIGEAKEKLGLDPDAEVLSCHEAGLQGFWIHRFLVACGVESLVVDPASIEVKRRRRRVKTDRVDVLKLMNMLLRHYGGETGMWSVVNPPSVEAEDMRRMHRELGRLKKELIQHANRILSLLRLHGPITVSINSRFMKKLETLKTWEGQPIPANALAEIEREYRRWQCAADQEKEIKRQMDALVDQGEETPSTQNIKRLQKLKGIGFKGSWGLTTEMFGWREFKNRKQIGSYLGMTGTPYDSGTVTRELGISKAGNARMRCLAVELAWNWLKYQPWSDITRWFHQRTRGANKRARRIAIVAVARKLAVALWHYLEHGAVPRGAILKN